VDKFIKGLVSMRLLNFLEDYDEHVSLGGTCRVSMKLKEKGFRKSSYPMDWIVISLSQLTDLLDNEFEGWVDRDNMVHLRDDWYENTRYGTGHKHEFKESTESRGDHLYDFNDDEDFSKWQDEKTHRAERFVDLLNSDKKVVFVKRSRMAKTGGGYIPTRLDPLGELRATCDFADYLKDNYPKLNFDILFINTGTWKYCNYTTNPRVSCVSEYQWNAL